MHLHGCVVLLFSFLLCSFILVTMETSKIVLELDPICLLSSLLQVFIRVHLGQAFRGPHDDQLVMHLRPWWTEAMKAVGSGCSHEQRGWRI